MNDIVEIGHNNPPSAIDMAREAIKPLATFLAANPVIQDHEAAREAKLFLDRVKSTIGDLDAAKEAEAKPHHTAWKAALDKFKPATEYVTKLQGELKTRLAAYIKAEEAKRAAELEAARKAQAEAEAAAREAERIEQEAKNNAAVGEIGVDVAAVIENADEKFAEYQQASRFAAIAERDAKVRIGGGFGKVASLRTKDVWTLDDPAKALASIGCTEGIREAILVAARQYYKLIGNAPDGVTITKERVL
jgi:hypothetical protein